MKEESNVAGTITRARVAAVPCAASMTSVKAQWTINCMDSEVIRGRLVIQMVVHAGGHKNNELCLPRGTHPPRHPLHWEV